MIYEILPVNNHKGNNNSTKFDFDFFIENENQLKVYLIDSLGGKKLLAYNIDYTINEFKNPNGSYITYPKEILSDNLLKEDETLSLVLDLPISQETQYTNSSLLNLTSLEYSLDYLTRLIQILSRKTDLSLKVQEGSNVDPNYLIEDLYEKSSDINTKYDDVKNKIETFNSTSKNLLETFETKANEELAKIQSTGFYMRDDKLYVTNSQGEEVEFKSGAWGEITGDITTQVDLNERFISNDDLSSFNPMIDSYVDGSSGYNIWANGYCEQWGKVTLNGTISSNNLTITFLKKFANTGYFSIASADAHNGNNIVLVGWQSETSMAIGSVNGYGVVCWKASGYLAEGEY